MTKISNEEIIKTFKSEKSIRATAKQLKISRYRVSRVIQDLNLTTDNVTDDEIDFNTEIIETYEATRREYKKDIPFV